MTYISKVVIGTIATGLALLTANSAANDASFSPYVKEIPKKENPRKEEEKIINYAIIRRDVEELMDEIKRNGNLNGQELPSSKIEYALPRRTGFGFFNILNP